MITIKDVAKKAGVSISTASRTLHNNGYVSKNNRTLVLNAAKELGYVVNVNAMQLKQKNQKTIGILISDITNPYFIGFIHELKQRLNDMSFDLLLTVSNGSRNDEAKQIKYLIGNKVSTILFIPSTSHNGTVMNLAKQNGINLIQLFVSVYKNIPSIVNDDADGVYQAANHLVKNGYHKILLLDVKFDENEFSKVYPRRQNGIAKCKNENPNVTFDTLNIVPSQGFSKETIKLIEEFNPDAIIAGTGSFGLNVLEYLKTTSRKIKLISFDDNEWLEYLGITSIRQSKEKLLTKTIELATSKEKLTNKHITIAESLVLRN